MILALLLAASAPAQPGRLVVLVVVDQLRYQDLLWAEKELGPRGFAGLGRPAPMRYETAVTETAADHSVLSTGAYADLNGIVGNRFSEGGPSREAVEDPSCPEWGAPSRGRSAAALRVPTADDAFKLNDPQAGRVVAVSIKDRSALFLSGTSADLPLWWEPETGQMVSTTCYAEGPPPFVPRDPAAQFRDWVWTMARPDAVVRLAPMEQTPGAVPFPDLGPRFPHRVGVGSVDKKLFLAVRNTPASTTIALRTARAAVEALRLGDSGKVDHLNLAIAALDVVGHQFGTVARERADTLLRIHDELGAFLAELRKRLGPRLSVMLSSDHGVTPNEPDQRRMRLKAGGSVMLDELTSRIEKAISGQLGPRADGWVAGIDGSSLYLRAPFPARAVAIAVELLRKEPGIWRAVPESEVDAAEPAIRHAYYPGRSGQVLIVPRPLWTLKRRTDGADHGTPWNDDALVPLMLQAPGYHLRHEPVFRATQVAPSISELLGTAPPSAALDVPAIERD